MKLIVGLGNPGKKYDENRHNVGFMFADWYVKHSKNGTEFKYTKYLLSDLCELEIDNHKILLAKPQTYMNKSGEAVQKLITKYQLPISSVIVAHDELDLPLGDFKINKTGSPLHNGVSSIEKALKTTDFLRLRIGVDNRSPQMRIDGETYVLSDFLSEERERLEKLFPDIIERLDSLL